ncbi:MAG: hypothetical protein ACI841_005143 [Planctomycetota bacterium]|jgi:hypothetical protein
MQESELTNASTENASDQPGTGGRRLAPVIMALVGLLLAFHPTLASGFERLQIRSGDPSLVHYILEHSWQWIRGSELSSSFWSPPCYAPFANVSAHSDVMLGAAPGYWVWRMLGLAPGLSFQLWMMLSLTLSFVGGHLFLRRHVGASPWAAAVGACLIGFGSSRLANFNSPQLFAIYPSIFALYFLGNALSATQTGRRRLSSRWLLAFFAAVTAQAWSAFYPAFFFAIVSVAACAAALLVRDARGAVIALLRSQVVALGIGLAVTAAALIPLATHHLDAAQNAGLREWPEVARALPTWASWLYTGSDHWLYGALAQVEAFRFTSAQSQHANGAGWVTTLLALTAFWRMRHVPVLRVMGLTTLLCVVVTTRWGEAGSLWQIAYDHVPGAGAMRYLARLGNFLVIPAGIGVALCIDRLRERRGWPVAIALAVICVVEQGHTQSSRDEQQYRGYIDRVASAVPSDAPAFLLTVVGGTPSNPRIADSYRRQVHLVAMWAAWEIGVPTVNGFYGLDPKGWVFRVSNASNQRQLQLLGNACATQAPPGTIHIRLSSEEVPFDGL